MIKKLKILALIGVLLLVFGSQFVPQPLQYVAEFQDVFNRELPKECVCIFQKLFVSGRDVYNYSYLAVIQGEGEELRLLVRDLGLIEKNPDEYEETQEIFGRRMEGLYPLKVRQGITLQLFEKRKTLRDDPDWCYIQAEIIDNRLYIYKVALAGPLSDSTAKRGCMLKLLWRKLVANL